MDINNNTFVCELSKAQQNYIRKKVTEYYRKVCFNELQIYKIVKSAMENRLWCCLWDDENNKEIIDINRLMEV